VAVKIVYEYAEVPAVDRASHEKAGWRIYGMSKFRDAGLLPARSCRALAA
jgi:hypothetical protein